MTKDYTKLTPPFAKAFFELLDEHMKKEHIISKESFCLLVKKVLGYQSGNEEAVKVIRQIAHHCAG